MHVHGGVLTRGHQRAVSVTAAWLLDVVSAVACTQVPQQRRPLHCPAARRLAAGAREVTSLSPARARERESWPRPVAVRRGSPDTLIVIPNTSTSTWLRVPLSAKNVELPVRPGTGPDPAAFTAGARERATCTPLPRSCMHENCSRSRQTQPSTLARRHRTSTPPHVAPCERNDSGGKWSARCAPTGYSRRSRPDPSV